MTNSLTAPGGDAFWPHYSGGEVAVGQPLKSGRVLSSTEVTLDVTDPADWHPEHEGSLHAPETNSGYDQDRTVEFDDSYDMERGF